MERADQCVSVTSGDYFVLVKKEMEHKDSSSFLTVEDQKSELVRAVV